MKIDDDSFFASHKAVPRANVLPDVRDAVLAYGYPTGGTSLSITKGIVSRIEFVRYNFPVSVCASRSMRPSTRAIAAAP